MKHYLFYDDESGEEFIVGADDLNQAYAIAKDYFESPIYQLVMSEFEAEASGLDEY